MHGFHHLRARTRGVSGPEPFPARTPWKRVIDYVMYVVGVTQPFALVPQVTAIYADHATQGVSPITWVLLTFFNGLWIVYGAAHKDKLIITTNALAVVFAITIVVGILR